MWYYSNAIIADSTSTRLGAGQLKKRFVHLHNNSVCEKWTASTVKNRVLAVTTTNPANAVCPMNPIPTPSWFSWLVMALMGLENGRRHVNARSCSVKSATRVTNWHINYFPSQQEAVIDSLCCYYIYILFSNFFVSFIPMRTSVLIAHAVAANSITFEKSTASLVNQIGLSGKFILIFH